MKIIGVVGGIGPESTIDYYRLLVQRFRSQPQPVYPSIVINSIDLARAVELVTAQRLSDLTDYLVEAVERLARAGADVALFAANTPHLVFDAIERRASIPLVSIVEATCDFAQGLGMTRVGLLGTRFTMQGRFYPDVFAKRGIEVLVPEAADQEYIHTKYMGELVHGEFLPDTRAGILNIVDRLHESRSIDGVILGGTELPLLLREATDHPLPFLDTTRIHVDAVVRLVSKGSNS